MAEPLSPEAVPEARDELTRWVRNRMIGVINSKLVVPPDSRRSPNVIPIDTSWIDLACINSILLHAAYFLVRDVALQEAVDLYRSLGWTVKMPSGIGNLEFSTP